MIDFYRTAPGWLSDGDLAAALEVVDIATMLLLDTHPGPADAESGAPAPLDHEQVHQATGVLIAAFGIPAAQALARLRAHTFATGRLVDDVARDIMARRLSPEDLAWKP